MGMSPRRPRKANRPHCRAKYVYTRIYKPTISRLMKQSQLIVCPFISFLRDSGLYVLFSDYSAKSMVTLRERAEALSVALDGFREMSKGTPYKTWLPVCEFILEEICSGIDSDHHPLDGEDSARYLRIAEGLPSPQRGHLISSIAMAQMEQGNVKDAQAAYSLLAASTDNGYFRQLALYQLASIRNMTKPK